MKIQSHKKAEYFLIDKMQRSLCRGQIHICFHKLIFSVIEQGLFNKPESWTESSDLILNQIV